MRISLMGQMAQWLAWLMPSKNSKPTKVMNRQRQVTDDKKNLIIQAAKEFPSDSGNVLWRAAFKAHPDWKTTLLDPTLAEAVAINRLYPLTSHLRDQGLFGEEMKAKSKDKKTHGKAGRVAWNKGLKTGPKGKRGNRGMQLYQNGTHAPPISGLAQPIVTSAVVEFNFCPRCGGHVAGLSDGANLVNFAKQHGISLEQLRMSIEAMVKAGVV